VNFLIDAQLPRQLARLFRAAGHDSLHTLDLPAGNRTMDHEINDLSVRDQRVVITKDEDFVNSFLIARRPYKLLLISTGNIRNSELMALIAPNIPAIVQIFVGHDFVELTRTAIIVHQ
jgi:predicted nuclease of predicted toxin-antitoxin system